MSNTRSHRYSLSILPFAVSLFLAATEVAMGSMYDKLKAMAPPAAARYVYEQYALIGKDPEVQRWIDENASLYADTVKTLRQTPRRGG